MTHPLHDSFSSWLDQSRCRPPARRAACSGGQLAVVDPREPSSSEKCAGDVDLQHDHSSSTVEKRVDLMEVGRFVFMCGCITADRFRHHLIDCIYFVLFML